jgi:putative membrane protein
MVNVIALVLARVALGRRGHTFFALLVALLVLVLIVLGIVLLVRLLRSPKHGTAPYVDRFPPVAGPAPTQYDPVFAELRMRYARGEIGRDEYLQRAADLGYGLLAASTPPGPGGPPATPMTGVTPG